MDCNTARMLATFFGRRGSELAPEDAADLATHLSQCSTCTTSVQSERTFDDRIGKAMMDVPVPSNLKAKLIEAVAVSRGAWCRQKAWAIAGFATAACLLIGSVIAWRITHAPELSVAEIMAAEDAKLRNPLMRINSSLSSRGIRFEPERAFDLNLFAMPGEDDFQGRQVPCLHFINRRKNADAFVYVVRDTDFNWSKLPRDGSSVPSSFGLQMAVLSDTHRRDVVYIVIFTGESLELFLENRSSL